MKKVSLVLLLLSLLAVGAVISLTVGTISLSVQDLLKILGGQGTSSQELVLFSFRLPRLLISLLAGLGLGISGYLFQTITHNDLADPGILGINAGAGFTVLLYLGFSSSGMAGWGLPAVACIGSLLASFLVYFCGYQQGSLSPGRLLLSGVAVNAGISALTILATVSVSRDNYNFVTSWLSGTIWGSTWQYVRLIFPWIMIILPILLAKGKTLEVMNLGDEAAVSLGVKLKQSQLLFLLCGVCLAAVSAAAAGSISFIGLIAPHIARSIVGKRNNTALLVTGAVGALLLLFGDILGRVILEQGELAAGIVVSIVGAPYFVFQLLSAQK